MMKSDAQLREEIIRDLPETTDLIERVARAAFAAHHHSGPTEEAYAEPNWGRGGFKTERVVWDAVAKAALEAADVPALQARVSKLEVALRALTEAVSDEAEREFGIGFVLATAYQEARAALAEGGDNGND